MKSYAQIGFKKKHGGSLADIGEDLLQTDDGGYIIASNTYSYGAGNSDIYIIKTDSSGDVIWTKTYGNQGDDEVKAIIKANDTGYILTGSMNKKVNGINDTSSVFIMKIDLQGNQIWNKTYNIYNYTTGTSICLSRDGYILGGQTATHESSCPPNNSFIMKTDFNGDTLWTKIINTNSCLSFNGGVDTTSNNGIILAENHHGSIMKNTSKIIKMDSAGTINWTTNFDNLDSNSNYYLSEIHTLSSNEYICIGDSGSYFTYFNSSIYLIKLNDSGQTIWTRTFTPNVFNLGNSIKLTKDGGYIITGSAGTSVYPYFDNKLILIKTDSNGVEEWSNTYQINNDFTKGNHVIQTSDLGYSVIGEAIDSLNNKNIYHIKTGKYGEIQLNFYNQDTIFISEGYPNPTNLYFNFNYQLPNNSSEGQFILYNSQGIQIMNKNLYNNKNHSTFTISDLKAGVYLYSLKSGSKVSEVKKLVIIK